MGIKTGVVGFLHDNVVIQMCIPLWLGSFGVIDILNEDTLIVCIYIL